MCVSGRGVGVSLAPPSLAAGEDGVRGGQAACCHSEPQAEPGAVTGPTVAMFHIRRQPVDEGGDPGEVVRDAGRIGTQGDGAEYT